MLAQRLIDVGGAHVQLAICRVRVAKPLDETERLAEIGGPLELELVDRRPWACRAHSSVLALCHDEPPASWWYQV